MDVTGFYAKDWIYGVVNGEVKKVRISSSIYRVESEDGLLIMERPCVDKLLRIIKENYPGIIFKLYKVKELKKSDHYYYVINGEIINFGLSTFYLVTLKSNGNRYVIFNPGDITKIKGLNLVDVTIQKYVNGEEQSISFID